jgi:uncharacterized membrane protein
MDSNGFKALAFLHFYLCGVVAAFSGYYDGPAAFSTILASSVLLTTAVLTALWLQEYRARRTRAAEDDPQGFVAGAGPAAVIVGWVSLGVTLATQSAHAVYAGYLAVLVLLLYRARTMEMEEIGCRSRLHARA